MRKISEWFKDNIFVSVAGFLGTMAVIAGSVITLDSRYAHAGTLQEVVRQQERQIDYLVSQNSQNMIFQIEYYEAEIQRLTAARNSLVATSQTSRVRPPAVNGVVAAVPVNPMAEEIARIDQQIINARTKRDFLIRQLGSVRPQQ